MTGVGHTYFHHRDYDESANDRVRRALDELREMMRRHRVYEAPIHPRTPRTPRRSLRRRRRRRRLCTKIYQRRQTARPTIPNECDDGRAAARLADQERAVVVVVRPESRQKRANGSTYDSKGQGLASFRESSELEYGADSAPGC